MLFVLQSPLEAAFSAGASVGSNVDPEQALTWDQFVASIRKDKECFTAECFLAFSALSRRPLLLFLQEGVVEFRDPLLHDPAAWPIYCAHMPGHWVALTAPGQPCDESLFSAAPLDHQHAPHAHWFSAMSSMSCTAASANGRPNRAGARCKSVVTRSAIQSSCPQPGKSMHGQRDTPLQDMWLAVPMYEWIVGVCIWCDVVCASLCSKTLPAFTRFPCVNLCWVFMRPSVPQAS